MFSIERAILITIGLACAAIVTPLFAQTANQNSPSSQLPTLVPVPNAHPEPVKIGPAISADLLNVPPPPETLERTKRSLGEAIRRAGNDCPEVASYGPTTIPESRDAEWAGRQPTLVVCNNGNKFLIAYLPPPECANRSGPPAACLYAKVTAFAGAAVPERPRATWMFPLYLDEGAVVQSIEQAGYECPEIAAHGTIPDFDAAEWAGQQPKLVVCSNSNKFLVALLRPPAPKPGDPVPAVRPAKVKPFSGAALPLPDTSDGQIAKTIRDAGHDCLGIAAYAETGLPEAEDMVWGGQWPIYVLCKNGGKFLVAQQPRAGARHPGDPPPVAPAVHVKAIMN